jgi:hypothetical protein
VEVNLAVVPLIPELHNVDFVNSIITNYKWRVKIPREWKTENF